MKKPKSKEPKWNVYYEVYGKFKFRGMVGFTSATVTYGALKDARDCAKMFKRGCFEVTIYEVREPKRVNRIYRRVR